MAEVTLTEWNAFLSQHPNAHLLQTGEWGELKAAFGWQAVRLVTGQCGAQILFRRLLPGCTMAYLPKGPVGAPEEAFWREVDHLCRARGAIFLKVEPDAWEEAGATSLFPDFRLSPHSIQPRRTILVDLRGSEEAILARMKQKCRYNIRLAEKKGVQVRAWDDVETFYRMMRLTGTRNGFGIHSLEYYRRAYHLLHDAGLAELLVAEYAGQPLAALFVCARGTSAWYLYGASTDAERWRMPTYLLQWEAMRWARGRGAETYDLWGVPDEDPDTLEMNFEKRQDGLWGVYRFKRGFGGVIQRAAAAQDRVYRPWLYQAYLAFLRGHE